jgi:hypothetical protein
MTESKSWAETARKVDEQYKDLSAGERAARRFEAYQKWEKAQREDYELTREGLTALKDDAYRTAHNQEQPSYNHVLDARRLHAVEEVRQMFEGLPRQRPNALMQLEHELRAGNMLRAEAVSQIARKYVDRGQRQAFDDLAEQHFPAARRRREAREKLAALEREERHAATAEGLRSRTSYLREKRLRTPMPDIAGRNLPGRKPPPVR